MPRTRSMIARDEARAASFDNFTLSVPRIQQPDDDNENSIDDDHEDIENHNRGVHSCNSRDGAVLLSEENDSENSGRRNALDDGIITEVARGENLQNIIERNVLASGNNGMRNRANMVIDLTGENNLNSVPTGNVTAHNERERPDVGSVSVIFLDDDDDIQFISEEQVDVNNAPERKRKREDAATTSAQAISHGSTSTSTLDLFCPVCLENFEDIKASADKTLVSTTCGHLFCDSCITKVFGDGCRCPTCRKVLRRSNVHKIYM